MVVEKTQEMSNPEMSCVFLDNHSSNMDRKSDELVEELTSQFFLEFLVEDLSR